jgi:hypothetical protein
MSKTPKTKTNRPEWPLSAHDLLMIGTALNLGALHTGNGAGNDPNTGFKVCDYMELLTREACVCEDRHQQIVDDARDAFVRLLSHHRR